MLDSLPSSKARDPELEKPAGATPTQVAEYIRFALTQLPGENGHHKFEQLCLHLARRRIYPNLVPSTGPVSAGGDQGADFESYKVGQASSSDSPFFARVSHEKVVFACSLEKNVPTKIKADLRAASEFHEKVDRLVFFSIWDVSVAKRHKLQMLAKETHGMQLDVFDARGISELLADTEIFWIAQEYLSIPSNLVLITPKTGDLDYEKALKVQVDPSHLTSSDFFIIKNAVRFATFSPEHRSDLPELIKKLRAYRQYPSPKIQRKAFYEEFVAALRGLEAVQRLVGELEQYLSAVVATDDPSELEDSSYLVTYAAGAIARGLLPIDISSVAAWKKKILDRVDNLLGEARVPSGRICALLSTKGYLTLLDWTEALSEEGDIQDLRRHSAAKAVPIWRKMIREAHNAPMFPLERFGNLLSESAGPFGNVKDFMKLVAETDSLLAQRFGKHKLAEQAFERSKSLLKAGKTLEAIDELHAAHVHAFTKESATQSVHFCIFLAAMYSEIHLHCAAKCYALAAAFAALKLEDDSLRSLAYRGLAEAASSDHANGASLSLFLSAGAFVFVSNEYSMSGSEKIKQFEWGRIDFYCLLLTRASALVDDALHSYLRKTILPSLGLDEIYDETVHRLDEQFSFQDITKLAEKAIEDGVMPPFSDVGEKRRLGWEQIGIRWFIDWPNDYETTKGAESLIATLQIFLMHIRNTELSLLAADVYLSLELGDSRFTIDTIPDNKDVRLRIKLHKLPSGDKDNSDHTIMVHAVGTSVLKVLSAIPQERFLRMYSSRLRQGLQTKLFPYASYDRLYDEFYSSASFTALHEKTQKIELSIPLVAVKTHSCLSGPTGIHPEYSRTESERAIRRRYERIPRIVRYTLPRLLADESFTRVITALKKEGWKDWHMLLAIANIRQNYVMRPISAPGSPLDVYRAKAGEIASREETNSDPAPSASLFTLEEMRRALTMSQMSTLKGLGFECSQLTPNLEAINRFLRRFNYWTDDVPHEKIFPD